MLLPQLIRDVRGRHRPEQGPGRSGLDVEAELDAAQALDDLLRVLERLRLVLRASLFDLAQLRDARGRRFLRELARNQEVARVPACDVDDLTPQADLLDVLEQDDFHAYLESETYGSNAISRARLTATATCR